MIELSIDNTTVEVPDGTTVLAAARALGIDIPALCCHPDHPPNTSCMCCLVKIDGGPPVPSCATKVRAGMRVESETNEIRELRRTGLELLLGDHAGDCHAPCEHTCPAHMDVPDMLRHVVDGDYRTAIAVVKRDIALPAILGRVCPEVCEAACRRGGYDSPAAICKIKRFVADRDLATDAPYEPSRQPDSGRRIAIVGGGPTGLTAAYHLTQRGHACTILDAEPQLGGRLWREFEADLLPRDVLAAEVAVTTRHATEVRTSFRLETSVQLDDLLHEFDVVLLATGRADKGWLTDLELKGTASGIAVDSATRVTSRERVYAAGNIVRSYSLVVQSVAEGKFVAAAIHAALVGRAVPDRRKSFESRLQRLTTGEMCDFCAGEPHCERVDDRLLVDNLNDAAVQREASRCLDCDCSALGQCLLHRYAEAYQCDARRFAGEGQHFRGRIEGTHVSLEVGKCIACGICVQIAAATLGAAGLAILGRSTAIRISPPPGVTLDGALGTSAAACAAACPTGAIALKPR